MTKIVQEKFQVVEPMAPKADHRWASFESARCTNGMQTRHPELGRYERNGARLNKLPPGQNIENQEIADIPDEPTAGGLGSGTQATEDVNAASLRQGFDRKHLGPTDDEYTRAHNDAFYDSVEVDGVEGFVERNNMLDRL